MRNFSDCPTYRHLLPQHSLLRLRRLDDRGSFLWRRLRYRRFLTRVGLPEGIDGSFGEPVSIDYSAKNMAVHHRTHKKSDAEILVNNGWKCPALDAAAE